MVEKITILTILVVAVLAISVVNLFSFTYVNGKIDGITGNVVAKAQTNPTPSPSPTPSQPSAPSKPSRVQVSLDGAPIKGDPNAPVTIVEFSDFECPFCGRFYSESYKQIEANYINTGKVKLAFKHFPLSFHPNAQKAAEASECANEQGKFWEMHDNIFENQDSLGISSYKQWARDLGLNGNQFDSCLDSGKYAAEVQAEFNEGAGYGVSGTPTLYVNGVEIVGAQPYSVFRQAIESELNN